MVNICCLYGKHNADLCLFSKFTTGSTAAAEEHQTASQVMRELMRDYIEKRRKAREYLRSKVNAGRASMKVGCGLSNNNVEEKFAAKRKAVR